MIPAPEAGGRVAGKLRPGQPGERGDIHFRGRGQMKGPKPQLPYAPAPTRLFLPPAPPHLCSRAARSLGWVLQFTRV